MNKITTKIRSSEDIMKDYSPIMKKDVSNNSSNYEDSIEYFRQL